MGLVYKIIPANVDEKRLPAETPQDYVVRLAQDKAQATALGVTNYKRRHSNNLTIMMDDRILLEKDQPDNLPDVIVAADTTVVDGQEILGKPANTDEALQMLQSLRGRVHQVFTGLAVLCLIDGELLTDWCVTDVWMREYQAAEMRVYVDSGDPLDKAGAYAIQHNGFKPVEKWQGCYANVMGLPVCTLSRLLEKAGVHLPMDTMQTCQASLLKKKIVCAFAPPEY